MLTETRAKSNIAASMMNTREFLFFLLIGIFASDCYPAKTSEGAATVPVDSIEINKVSEHVYRHTSLFHSQDFGVVPCNGMIVVAGREAIVFDTPVSRDASAELIDWVEKELGCSVTRVIPTHGHLDCLGGLEVFHERGIPSHANQTTIRMAAANELPIPMHGFTERLELSVGNLPLVAEFVGEGHTTDNIVGYFPKEKILFGGCLIKELGAGKGNLADANVAEWPRTAARLKERYPEVELVIPGHGKAGGIELIDYTRTLFARD